jgi:predicted DNA-binding protein (UPF0251 family)
MLVEGMSNGGDRPHGWTRFSGAMVRQAVDDGVRMLPPQQKELIKLAYFGGLSNAEIARCLGITIRSVERGLQEAVARVSHYVERGRAAGLRAVYAVAIFFCGRSLFDSQQVATAASIVAIAAVLVASPVVPPQPTQAETQTAPAVVFFEPEHTDHTIVAPAPSAVVPVTTEVPVTLPVTLPIQLKTPQLPSLPLPHGLLGA